MSNRYKVHRGCGGGISYDGPELDGRPRFICSKCRQSWSCGLDGGEWAPLVDREISKLVRNVKILKIQTVILFVALVFGLIMDVVDK